MSGDVLKKANIEREQLLGRKQEIAREREEIDKRLADLDRFLAMYGELSGEKVFHTDLDDTSKSETKPQRPKNSPKEEVAREVRQILIERGEPMSRADLFRALKSRGLTIAGTDSQMVLSTMLWRARSVITRIKGGGYWLAERPLPEAGYEPPPDAEAAAREFDLFGKLPHEPTRNVVVNIIERAVE